MVPKSGRRFSEKIMRKQKASAGSDSIGTDSDLAQAQSLERPVGQGIFVAHWLVRKAQPDLLEGLADPGGAVFARFQPAALHQAIGVLIPGAVGEIMPEHGRGRLRLADDAERHV